jgi:hypothetical protein
MKPVCAAFITALKIVREPEALLKFNERICAPAHVHGNRRSPSATPLLAELAAAND